METYRLTVRPSFSAPHWAELSKDDDEIRIQGVRGRGLYGPPTVPIISKAIASKQWDQFQALLERESFWGTMTSPKLSGCDGETWTLKGQRREEQKEIQAWCPEQLDEAAGLVAIGEFLFELLRQ